MLKVIIETIGWISAERPNKNEISRYQLNGTDRRFEDGGKADEETRGRE